MVSHSFYEAICPCGRTNSARSDGQTFTCSCGRKSIIDFTIGYSERELVEILNNLDAQRDHLVRAIEVRRQRVAS